MNFTITIPENWQKEPFEFWMQKIKDRLKESRLGNQKQIEIMKTSNNTLTAAEIRNLNLNENDVKQCRSKE